MRRVARVLLACLLVIFASRVLWYDFKGIFDKFVGLEGYIAYFLRAQAAVISLAVLLPTIALVLAYRRVGPGRLVFLYLGVGLYSAILGLAMGNDLTYLIGDTFKWTLVPAGAMLAYWASTGRDLGRLFLGISLVILIGMVVRWMVFGHYFHTGFGFVYGTPQELFALFCLIGCAIYLGPGWKRVAAFAGVALCIGLMLLGQKRTTLGLAVLGIGVILLALGNRRSTLILGFMVVISALALVGLVTSDELRPRSLGRLAATNVEEKIGSGSPRVGEIRSALAELDHHRSWAYLSGLGAGATFAVPIERSGIGAERLHSIHFTPMGMLLRSGIFGLMCYLVLCLMCLTYGGRWVIYMRRQSELRRLGFDGIAAGTYFGAALYCMLAPLASLTLYGLVDDPLVGACVAALAQSHHATEQPETRQRADWARI